MASEIQQFFRDHGISEVEAIIPDMAGIARGKIMPAEKFAEDEGMRLPESVFLQTVTGDQNPRYYRLLRAVELRTGVPVVINTSFNVRGEPIVTTPADAYRCFMATHIDALVIENFLLLKERQPAKDAISAEAFVGQFAPD